MPGPDPLADAPAGPSLPPPTGPECPNCGAPAPGRFCPACGQRQTRRLASLRSMAAAALADQFSLEAALPRTLRGLCRPGFLTREYLAGRIARYIPPFRLYLVSSLVFFFTLSLTTGPGSGSGAAEAADAPRMTVGAAAEDDRPVDIAARMVGDTTEMPSWQRSFARYLLRQAERLEGMDVREFERSFNSGLRANAPKAAFVLIPVFALYLKLLYLRRRRLYAEHFVFALHVHAFAFLLFTLRLLIPGNAESRFLFLLFGGYLFFALLRVYRQSVPRTVLKWGLLAAGYGLTLLLVLMATAVVTALTL